MADTDDRVRVEVGPKRVRVYFGGELLADTLRPRLVWEIPYYPAYYIPAEDVRMDRLTPTGGRKRSPSRGEAHCFTVRSGERVAQDAAWHYPDSPVEALRGLVRFEWEAMDAWFEEDERVYTHPRSPYARVDVLAGSRPVEVQVKGETVAASPRPTVLFETGLPPRYYLPLVDVRMELLRPSSTVTHCPYKGTATYWSVEVGGELFPDLVWTYRTTLPESVRIAGLVAFLNEKVDLLVGGDLQERPRTPFS